MKYMAYHQGNYSINMDKSKLDINMIHNVFK